MEYYLKQWITLLIKGLYCNWMAKSQASRKTDRNKHEKDKEKG